VVCGAKERDQLRYGDGLGRGHVLAEASSQMGLRWP
jgi:hypothetical protein